jgi:hypothetical protein
MMSLRTIREDKRNYELLQPLDWSSDIPLHLQSVKIPIGQLVTLPDEKKKTLRVSSLCWQTSFTLSFNQLAAVKNNFMNSSFDNKSAFQTADGESDLVRRFRNSLPCFSAM